MARHCAGELLLCMTATGAECPLRMKTRHLPYERQNRLSGGNCGLIDVPQPSRFSFHRVRIVHSDGDRNQTSEEFNASKSSSPRKLLHYVVRYMLPNVVTLSYDSFVKKFLAFNPFILIHSWWRDTCRVL